MAGAVVFIHALLQAIVRDMGEVRFLVTPAAGPAATQQEPARL